MKPIFLTTFLIAFYFNTWAQIPYYRITPWYDNKKAAACITFDDNCSGQFTTALPYLNAKGAKATFFTITKAAPCGAIAWDSVKSAYNRGHEIGSHSVSHLDFTKILKGTRLDTAKVKIEMKASYDTIRARLGSSSAMTIAWPYGGGGGSSKISDTVRALAQKIYIGARNASVNANGFESYKPWTSNRFYYRIGSYLINNSTSASTIATILDSTAKHYGWYTALYHGIQDQGFNLLPGNIFKSHIDSMVAREDKLWITPFKNALQYHKEQYAQPKLNLISATTSLITLSFTDTIANNALWTQALTLRMKNPIENNVSITEIRQNGMVVKSYPSNFKGDSVQFNIVPDGGVVEITLSLITGLQEKTAALSSYSLSPIPAKDMVHIQYEAYRMSSLKIEIMDLRGNIVLKKTMEAMNPENPSFDVSLESFSTGLYFIKVGDDAGFSEVKKLVVE